MVAAAFMLLQAPAALLAHGLLVSVTSEGAQIVGTAYYTNGEKAVAQSISLVDLATPEGEVVSTTSDQAGQFSFPAIGGHRYRVTVFGDEGHSTEMELTAGDAKPARLIDKDTAAEPESWLPPAWAMVGGLLLLSLIPAWISRRRTKTESV